MKKLVFGIALLGLVFATSCEKKEETAIVVDENTDSITVETTEVPVLDEAAAKAKVEQAQKDLDAAIANGDKAAEEAARKALDDASQVWENVKAGVTTTANDVKEGVTNAVDNAKTGVENATDKVKEGVNNTVKDAKEVGKTVAEDAKSAAKDVKETGKEAAKDVKEGVNNALDKAKLK